MIVYLDTSAVLRVLLRESEPLEIWGRWDTAYSSELLGVEARRAIDRLRLQDSLTDLDVAALQRDLRQLEQGLTVAPVSSAILRRASLPMATAVKTLDAIHLATAMLFRERRRADLAFATHDTRQATAARALGFETVGT